MAETIGEGLATENVPYKLFPMGGTTIQAQVADLEDNYNKEVL